MKSTKRQAGADVPNDTPFAQGALSSVAVVRFEGASHMRAPSLYGPVSRLNAAAIGPRCG
ncbi:hypothetical protein MPL3365_10312 [Mesorhizobium plurifarium]|uniref:Uncharacterized protein n=1 Tax=Mesorhizobium plurifarium TaxID=69974 RepID=A0A090FTT2_MESPL|nr:hypothetical protein MPL3365_10312 [Mesorhizobium plurifarium]